MTHAGYDVLHILLGLGGVKMSVGGYGAGGGFALIVVLFILLIIVGAGGFAGGYGY